MTEPQSPPLFGVVLPEKDPNNLPIPTRGPYFVPAKQGWMVHKKFHWGRVLTPVKEAEALHDREPYLWPEINLPIELLGQAWAFFAAIYELHKSEAMVDITWSEKHGYRLFCPPQRATSGGVHAKRTLEHYQGQIVGTIHSHCNFGAFHSSTDTHDADGHDGLHITLGKNMHQQPEIAVMISVGTVRWHFKPEELWEDISLTKQKYPWWWIPKVGEYKEEPKSTVTFYGAAKPTSQPTSKPTNPVEKKPEPTQTSIVAYTDKSKGSEDRMTYPLMKSEYVSVDEFLYHHGEEMTSEEAKDYEEINMILDDIDRTFDLLGLDFDYSITPQIGAKLPGSRSQREEEFADADFDINEIPEAVRHWFN